MTVLLVEDNLSNVQLIRGIFGQRPEVTLAVATSGREAIEHFDNQHFDLILLDNHLPDTSGMELLGRIKKDPKLAPTPVVMVSADATAGQIAAAYAAGAASYLTKPIDVKQFLAVVTDVADSRPESPAESRPESSGETSAGEATVLYVEDDEMNRTVMSRVFARHLPDLVLEMAVDGYGALEAARELDPRLIVIDRGLPDMSGLSVVEAWQEDARTASIPVLVLSGEPPPADWIATPVRDYLMKPYDIDRLVEVIQRLLRG